MARFPNVADDLALHNRTAGRHGNFVQVSIRGLKAVAVVKDHIVAPIIHPFRRGYHAVGCSINGGHGGCRNILAGSVHPSLLRHGLHSLCVPGGIRHIGKSAGIRKRKGEEKQQA